MTRFLILFLIAIAPPLCGTVVVYYRHAEPRFSRFYKRLASGPTEGYRLRYTREFRLQTVERLKKGSPVQTWKYAHTQSGLLTACDRYDGKASRAMGWRYNKTGQITTRIRFVGQGRYNRPWRVYRISYNATGQRTSEREMVGDKVLRTIQYSYHPDGEVLSRAIYSLSGYLQERVVYRTNDAGQITEALAYRWGRLVKVHVYRYSPEGCPLEPQERKPIPGDPIRDPLTEPVKPLTGPGG